MKEKLKEILGEGWFYHLSPFFDTKEFNIIRENLKKNKRYYPFAKHIFNAFRFTPWEKVRVVILGQDPYHGIVTVENNKQVPQAIGLAFGVPNQSITIPPSLVNIRTELENEYDDLILDFNYSLKPWADQGVLLLNTALTVKPGEPGSYIDTWKPFTTFVIQTLAKESNGLIWLLWGSHAKQYEKYINPKFHHILKSGHPSPLSANRGFWFGNGHFKKTNEIIESQNGKSEIIKWYEKKNIHIRP